MCNYVLPHPPLPACLPLPRAHLPTPRSTSVPYLTRRSAVTPAGGCGQFLLPAPALCFLTPSPPPPPAGVCRSDRSHGAYRLPGHHRPAVGNRVPSNHPGESASCQGRSAQLFPHPPITHFPPCTPNHPGESVSCQGRSALPFYLTPSLAPNPQLPNRCPSFLHTQSSIASCPFPFLRATYYIPVPSIPCCCPSTPPPLFFFMQCKMADFSPAAMSQLLRAVVDLPGIRPGAQWLAFAVARCGA